MRTTKTDKILNLVSGNETASERAAEAAAPKNPLVRVPDDDEVPIIFIKDAPGFQLINVTFLLINEQLGQVMERFNCCTCPKCTTAVTNEALHKLPSVVVEVSRKSDAYKVNLLAAKHRAEVTKVLTKAVIGVKSLMRHEK